ncbi:MAG: Trp family transcriptional regulator [Bdellovibrionota bacterium]
MKPNILTKTLKNAAKKEKDLDQYLDILLSPKEKNDIENRIKILTDLLQNKPQRQIAQDQKVSIYKVTRGARLTQHHQKFLEKILSKT